VSFYLNFKPSRDQFLKRFIVFGTALIFNITADEEQHGDQYISHISNGLTITSFTYSAVTGANSIAIKQSAKVTIEKPSGFITKRIIMKKLIFVLSIVFFTGTIFAEENKNPTAVGLTIDVLPTIMSATEKKPGYAFQTWFGSGHMRLRAVGAHMYYNDKLIGNNAFKDQSLNVGALIVDYVFGNHFDGAWVGGGYELWNNGIKNKKTGQTHHWNNNVMTIGGGYIVPVKGNFYIEPWGAAHLILNNKTIHSGDSSFTPKRFSAEVSLKTGYFFDL
jgi:hypothetical protein